MILLQRDNWHLIYHKWSRMSITLVWLEYLKRFIGTFCSITAQTNQHFTIKCYGNAFKHFMSCVWGCFEWETDEFQAPKRELAVLNQFRNYEFCIVQFWGTVVRFSTKPEPPGLNLGIVSWLGAKLIKQIMIHCGNTKKEQLKGSTDFIFFCFL